MKQFGFILLIVFVAFGCNKKVKHARQMNGTWSIHSYTQITGAGFETEYMTQGTVSFEDLGDGNLTYSEDFSYNDGTNWIPMNRIGNITIAGEQAKSFELTFTSPINTSTLYNSTHVVSKDDLKIEFQENGVGHLFVLKKD